MQVSALTPTPTPKRNPYGIAGSPGGLKKLSMPQSSTFYDWTPRENAVYITVRPYCPPRNCDGTKPWELSNYWFWDATTRQIGHNASDRIKFREFVLRNKGKVWIIGNEPEDRSQDNLVAIEYAKMFHTYHTQVKQFDPTAKFAITSIAGVVHYREFPQMQTYYDAVFSEYIQMYGVSLPFDYWNLHAYYHGWLSTHPDTSPEMVNLVFSKIINPYLQYRQIAQEGLYKNKPILATEIGIAAKDLHLSSDQVIEYMELFTNRLLPLVANNTLESFFWFYGGWTDGTFIHSSLLQSDWTTPTALGRAYAQEAQKWSQIHEPSPTKTPTPIPSKTLTLTPTKTPAPKPSDFDQDGDIDYKDLLILKKSNKTIFNYSLLVSSYRR